MQNSGSVKKKKKKKKMVECDVALVTVLRELQDLEGDGLELPVEAQMTVCGD